MSATVMSSNDRSWSSSRVARTKRSIVAWLLAWLGGRTHGASVMAASPRTRPPGPGALASRAPYPLPSPTGPAARGPSAGQAEVARGEQVGALGQLRGGALEHEVA